MWNFILNIIWLNSEEENYILKYLLKSFKYYRINSEVFYIQNLNNIFWILAFKDPNKTQNPSHR